LLDFIEYSEEGLMLGTFYHSPDGGTGGGRSGAKGRTKSSKSTKRGDGQRLALLRAFVMTVPAQYGEQLEKFVALCNDHKSKLSANSFREILVPIAV